MCERSVKNDKIPWKCGECETSEIILEIKLKNVKNLNILILPKI